MTTSAALEEYFRKRTHAIDSLVENPVKIYSEQYFHKLHVEIKKLHALYCLIAWCSEDFKSREYFKLFRNIFKQAGKIRELHLLEDELEKYAAKYPVKNYLEDLKDSRLHEQKTFVAMKNEKLISALKRSYRKVKRYFKGITKRNLRVYLGKQRKKIVTFFDSPNLKVRQVHKLRKLLKAFHYILKSSGLEKEMQIMPLRAADHLQDLLGKWHDRRVMAWDLKKAVRRAKVVPVEKKHLEKILSEFVSDCEMLLEQINGEVSEIATKTLRN